MVVHIVPTTANYLRFLAILVSGAYAPANTVALTLVANFDRRGVSAVYHSRKKGLSTSLGDKTVASSNRSCISSASFGVHFFYC